mgnify:FL=1|tara:strand:+ start:13516 stop:13983 length:468 start_codon:yes stop_codon:yes gene_type:complete
MARFLVISLFVVVFDQYTKIWIISNFQEYEVLQILPIFNLTLVFNSGAAFSFLADAGGWQVYFLSFISIVVSCILLFWLLKLEKEDIKQAIGISLILGGAVGNLIDRLFYGKVTDFLQWHWGQYYFPSFNIADSAITLGVIFLILDIFLTSDQKK